jgi:hypothetical protein
MWATHVTRSDSVTCIIPHDLDQDRGSGLVPLASALDLILHCGHGTGSVAVPNTRARNQIPCNVCHSTECRSDILKQKAHNLALGTSSGSRTGSHEIFKLTAFFLRGI